MIHFLKNIQELSVSSIVLKHGDEVVLADPDVRFFLSKEGNKLSMRTGPVRSDAVVKALAVAFEKFIGRQLQDLPDFVGPSEPILLMEMTIPSEEDDTKRVEFDCKTESCPIFPGRKRCHKNVKYTTDPVTGHVWEEIFRPCGHIRHDQTAFYEQMSETVVDSSKLNFDTCIEPDQEMIPPSTGGSQQITPCENNNYGVRYAQQKLSFQCTSRHLYCPNRRDNSEVTCTADIDITIPPTNVPFLICKMPCGSYFDYTRVGVRPDITTRLNDLSLKTGFNIETVKGLLENLTKSDIPDWKPEYGENVSESDDPKPQQS